MARGKPAAGPTDGKPIPPAAPAELEAKRRKAAAGVAAALAKPNGKPAPRANGVPTPAPGRPVLITRRVSEIVSKPVEWLWPARIPFGMLTVVDGPPEMGKTLTLLDLAARVTTGRPLPFSHAPTQRGNVAVLTAEDSAEHVIRPRLDAAGATTAGFT